MSTINIIIGTHGRFGEALIQSAEMIAGKMEGVFAVSLLPDMSLENYLEAIDQQMSILEGKTVVLVDLFGGTPSNAFSAYIQKYHYPVVTGVNFPMLIDLYLKISNDDSGALDPFELAAACVNTVQESSVITNDYLQNSED